MTKFWMVAIKQGEKKFCYVHRCQKNFVRFTSSMELAERYETIEDAECVRRALGLDSVDGAGIVTASQVAL